MSSEDWTGDALYFEYTKAANPVGSGHTPPVPIRQFPASLHEQATTEIVPLDLSDSLGTTGGPVTSPGLCASFVRILAGEDLTTSVTATSELFFVLRGNGYSQVDGEQIRWRQGDLFVLPFGAGRCHHASADTVFYWVHDAPLLRYLGVAPTGRRFRPTMFEAHQMQSELEAVASSPRAQDRNRLSVLLASAEQPQTLTATPVLWAMYGLLPEGAVQRPTATSRSPWI